MTDLLVFIMILLGSSIMLLGSVGLIRFPDVYARIHALGVSSTLGIGCILLASFTFFCFVVNAGSVKEIILVVVLFAIGIVGAMVYERSRTKNIEESSD